LGNLKFLSKPQAKARAPPNKPSKPLASRRSEARAAARVRHGHARVADAVSMADRDLALQLCCSRGNLLVWLDRGHKLQCRQTTLSQGADLLVERLTSAWQPAHAGLTRSTAEKSQKPINQTTPDNVRSVSTLIQWSVVPGALARWVSREMERSRCLRSGCWNGDRGLNCEVEPGLFLGRMRYRFSAVPAAEGMLVGEAMVLWLEVRLVTGVARAWNA
jgi:hypothetical protein